MKSRKNIMARWIHDGGRYKVGSFTSIDKNAWSSMRQSSDDNLPILD